jgi:uncharacterized protein (DUF885 family)
MYSLKRLTCLATGGLWLWTSALCAQGQPASTEERRKTLNDLLEQQWEYSLRVSPIKASFLGDKRWNDQLDDFSQAAIDQNLQETQKFLTRFEAINTTGFPDQEALNKTLIVRDLKLQMEGARFKPWEMPIEQQNGVQVWLPDLVNVLSFATVKDYEDYISRLKQVPRVLDQITVMARKGMHDGLMPPKFLLEESLEQCKTTATTPVEKSTFAQPFFKFPSNILPTEQERLRAAGLAAVKGSALPAFVRFTAFLKDEYVPQGRSEPGIWALPDGDARYQYLIQTMTTTVKTPDEIHQLGLKEVAEIEGQMLEVAHQLGYQDLAKLNEHIKTDRKFYATTGQQLLDLYSGYVKDMEPELPKLFGRLPKAKLVVIPMEASRSPQAVPADYTSGTANGSRPGHINVNEYDPLNRLLLNAEAIAYHEGIPGHHLQLSIAEELEGFPEFRRYEDYTAFVEGWALYSERLGKEVGMYQDPYSNYGRLENEMWRAIRLVVDTGVHSQHWTRQQMVDYFHKYTAMDEPNVQTEVDRYIAWPAQALAYKLGQLEILKLRQLAKDAMGERFDIRAFHDEVLGEGALPLNVLDAQVTNWVITQKSPMK